MGVIVGGGDGTGGESGSNQIGELLPHIPAYHVEALIDSFHALRRADPPMTMARGARGWARKILLATS